MSQSNSRFRTAVHALAVISFLEGEPARSERIAASVATDATVVRRLLSLLRNNGLVSAAEGRHGGYVLARSSARITLLDIYRAVSADELFPMPDRRPNASCPVGRHIHRVLDAPLDAAHLALEQELAGTTLAEVMNALATANARGALF